MTAVDDLPAGVDSSEEGASCPVAHIAWQGADRKALTGFAMLDELRAKGPAFRTPDGPGTHMVMSHDENLRVLQHHESFPASNRLFIDGQEVTFELVPTTLNGPEHT